MVRWVQRDAQTWWAIVQRQMESGLSQVAFCAAEGLSVSSLQVSVHSGTSTGAVPGRLP